MDLRKKETWHEEECMSTYGKTEDQCGREESLKHGEERDWYVGKRNWYTKIRMWNVQCMWNREIKICRKMKLT